MKYSNRLLFLKDYIFIFSPIFLIAIANISAYFFNINFYIILLIAIATVVSIYPLYKELLKYVNYFQNKIVLVLMSVFSLSIAYVSNIFVNKYIVEFTHLKPSFFPLAQQILFPFVGIILWVVFLYFFLLFILIMFSIKTIIDEHKNTKKRKNILGQMVRSKKHDNQWITKIGLITIISILLVVSFPLTMKFLFSENYKNNVLKKIFIFSSYYQNYKRHICDNVDENDFIAFLNKDNISFTKNIDSNMTIHNIKCIKKSNNNLERNKLP